MTRGKQSRSTAKKMAEYRNAVVSAKKSLPSRVRPIRTSPRTKKSGKPDRVNNLEVLAGLPETPVRGSTSRGRKRVHAPSSAESYGEPCTVGISSPCDSDMPSKKRKTFNTPPPKNGNSSESSQEISGVPEGYTSSFGSSPHSRETTGTKPLDRENENIEGEFMDMESPLRNSGRSVILSQGRPAVAVRSLPRTRGTDYTTGSNTKNVNDSRLREDLRSDDGLEMATVASLTLSKMFNSMYTKIMGKISELHKSEMEALKRVESTVLGNMNSKIKHLEGVVQLSAGNGAKSSVGGKNNWKTSLIQWEEKLNMLTPNVEIVFNTDVFSSVICYNAPKSAVEVYTSREGSGMDCASEAFQTLFFSKQPGEKKFLLSDGVGKLHSDFKHSVVQNSFFNVCADTFGIFASQHVHVHESEDVRTARPSWLSRAAISLEHISSARKFLEMTSQSRKGMIRETPTASDISIHGAIRVYRLLGAHLRATRENIRISFFIGLGYLLTTWKDLVSDTNQNSMELKFTDDDVSFALEDIPLTTVCTGKEDSKTIEAADAENKKKLNDLFTNEKGMVLTATHEVHIVDTSGAQRVHHGGKKSTLRRLINCIDVARDVCVEYCRAGSRERFFRAHPVALRCIMIFASLFKALALEFMEQSITTGLQPMPKTVKVNMTCLQDLIPGPNVQRNLLESKCLRYTKKEYDILHHAPYGQEYTSDVEMEIDPMLALKGTVLEASESLGIALL